MLTIGYCGTLAAHEPAARRENPLRRFFTDWFWNYHVRNIHSGTRSGYYLLSGVAALNRRMPDLADRLRMEFWGFIAPGNTAQADRMGIGHLLHVGGFMPQADSQAKLAECDLLFLPLESSAGGQKPLFIPGKLYEFLAMGKPILSLVETGTDCARILERSGLGIMVPPFSPDDIAGCLETLIRNRDNLAEMYRPDWDYIQRFHSREIAARMAAVFRELDTGEAAGGQEI